MGTLERLRKAKGLSQQDVGGALGISQAAVAMWENGKSKTSRRTFADHKRNISRKWADIRCRKDRSHYEGSWS